jgi:hypothetical protein
VVTVKTGNKMTFFRDIGYVQSQSKLEISDKIMRVREKEKACQREREA